MIERRRALAGELAETIRAHAQTASARRTQWAATFDHLAGSDSITSIRSQCDHACTHLDAEIILLAGDIDALRVEIEQMDAELHCG